MSVNSKKSLQKCFCVSILRVKLIISDLATISGSIFKNTITNWVKSEIIYFTMKLLTHPPTYTQYIRTLTPTHVFNDFLSFQYRDKQCKYLLVEQK